MRPEDLLDEARRANLNKKPKLVVRVWWWMRSRCKECGSRRIRYENSLGVTQICSTNKKHKDYIWDLNLTAFFAVTTFCLLVILLAMIFGQRTVTSKDDRKSIPDGYIDYPYP